MNKTEIRKLLIELGVNAVTSTSRIARILGLNPKTIGKEKNKGHLKQIDRDTYAMESLVDWLHGHQRYLVHAVESQHIRKDDESK